MILSRSFLTSGLMLLILTGCQSKSFNDIFNITKPKSFNDIVKETKKSVALISYGDKKGHGTGFFVQVEGQCAVLTAAHVVRSSQQINIRPHIDKKLFHAANIEEISGKDLAVITFSVDGEENCPYTALKLNKSRQIDIFDTVVMVGYPTREGEAILVLQSSKGEISSIEDPPLPQGYAISYDMTTVGGMSGAPVINKWGEVVAVHGKTDVEIVSLGRSQQSSLSAEQNSKVEEIAQRLGRINHFKWGIPIETYVTHQSSVISSPLREKVKTVPLEKDAEKLRLEGDRLRHKKQYKEAIKFYNKALKISLNDAAIWNSLGLALSELGSYEKSIKSNRQDIKSRGLGRYKEAIKSYDKAIEISPDYIYAWYNRGFALEKLGRYEEAIKSYDKALEIDPNHEYAINNKKRLLEKLKSRKKLN
ncbi:MAG: tetratricopeptide repeat-containing serine protease family protein [Crocosphaera sp.]